MNGVPVLGLWQHQARSKPQSIPAVAPSQTSRFLGPDRAKAAHKASPLPLKATDPATVPTGYLLSLAEATQQEEEDAEDMYYPFHPHNTGAGGMLGAFPSLPFGLRAFGDDADDEYDE